MGVFELVEETRKQVIVKVDAKDPLTIARHPYVDAQMAYITVTRGDDHIYTIVRDDGSTWSWCRGKKGYTCVSENTERLMGELDRFFAENHIFLDVCTELNPYAAKFYTTKNRRGEPTNTWWVDFEFCDTKSTARKYFDMRQYPTPHDLAVNGLSKYNELFKNHGAITEEPNRYVGVVYRVEIGEDF